MAIHGTALLVFGLILLSPALAGDAPPRNYAPLRPIAECLDPGRVRAIQPIQDEQVLVDAGRRHFRLTLQRSCPDLAISTRFGLSSRNPSNRICGDIGDRIVLGRGGVARASCGIARVLPISAAAYAAALHER